MQVPPARRGVAVLAALAAALGLAGCVGDQNVSGEADAGGGPGGADAGAGGGGTGGRGGVSGGGGTAGGGGTDGGVVLPPSAGVVAAGVRWFGRVDTTNPAQPKFSWSGTGFLARFSGTGLSMRHGGGQFIFKAVVDGVPQATFTTTTAPGPYPIATGLAAGEHTVQLYRQTEGPQGESQLMGLTVDGGGLGGGLLPPPDGPARLIEVIGDSISAGYGNLGALADADCFHTESAYDTYESVAARALGAEVSIIAASGRGVIRNYGGDTTDTMPMVYGRALSNLATPAWDFHIQPHAVVINLGTNDISNNKGDPGTAFEDTYRALLETVRAKYPGAYILCIIGPLLSGADLAAIQGHLRAAVAARNAAGDARVSFFDQIAAQTTDKYACQYHPNVAENMLMGGQLATELGSRLGWTP